MPRFTEKVFSKDYSGFGHTMHCDMINELYVQRVKIK
jgi:hypothetical protein